MKGNRKAGRRPARTRRGRGSGRREWIGGRLRPPFGIADENVRPEMIVWMEMPGRTVVFHEIFDPDTDPVGLGEALERAIRAPLHGSPRKPHQVRVADEASAEEVRAVLPDVEVEIAPTPELTDLLEYIVERAAEESDIMSYLQDDRIPTEAVQWLFENARILHHIAPWEDAMETQVARIDIPRLGIEGACLSIIGAGGESRGILLFPSKQAFERFLTAAVAAQDSGEPVDLQTSVLALNFEAADDVPGEMLEEILDHEWPVAGSDAFPVLEHRDAQGVPQSLTEHDVQVMSACASALAAFCGRHRDLFSSLVVDEPVCESFFDENDLEVRITVPYDSMELFDLEDGTPLDLEEEVRSQETGTPPSTRRSRGRVGRNDPCPCGSGKKYKRCCLEANRETEGGEEEEDELSPEERRRLERLVDYARDRFGDGWFERSGLDFEDPELALPLLFPWALHHVPVDGKPVSRWLLEDPGEELTGPERTWLLAQSAAWLSVWEAQAVEPGISLTLRDLLTGEERVVRETLASESVLPRTNLLCRVVEEENGPTLDGLHPRPLPPEEAEEVLARIRRKTRRKSGLSIETLQRPEIGRALIAYWEEAVAAFRERAGVPPRLQNTDGDPLLLTADTFTFDAAHRDEIGRRLEAQMDSETSTDAEGARVYTFLRPGNRAHPEWEGTVIGRAILRGRELRVESNSSTRADGLRQQIETALGDRIRHRDRHQEDPVSAFRDGSPLADAPGDLERIPPREKDRVIRELKARHYSDWADQPLPALEGKTPREAVRSRAGREKVDLLLRSCEHHEARQPAGQRFDFSSIREGLGLSD